MKRTGAKTTSVAGRREGSPSDAPRSRIPLLPLVCFIASGASGLIYQIVWMRQLTLIFGATTLAVSTVLAAFMGGLAVGSLWGGRLADRTTRPLAVYARIEFGIGIYGLLVPLLFSLLPLLYQPLWRAASLSFTALSLVRFALAALVLALPTALMGATLPVLSRFVAHRLSTVGRDVGALYTVNTVGAVLGASIGGLLLIPAIGLFGTTLAAAMLNIFAGALAAFAARSGERASGDDAKRARPHTATRLSRQTVVLMVAFGVSGTAALIYEVAWTRALALVLGSSVYAFSIMLTTFLVGLALGSGIGSRIADRTRRPVLTLAVVECAAALAAFGSLFLLAELPYVFVVLYQAFAQTPLGLLLATRLIAAALVMLIPTTLIGMIFPLAVKAAASTMETLGATVGRLYAANTLGAIVGAFGTGFLLIPWLGVEGSLVAAVCLNAAAAVGLFAVAETRHVRARIVCAVTASVLAALAVPCKPVWNPTIMASGVYRYAPSIKAATRAEFYNRFSSGSDGELLYYRDGVSGTVTVQKQYGYYVLKVNGKPDATTAGDLPTQALIAHLPLLVHPNPKSVLIVGWGSGVSVGAALTHPVERVTAVELEPAVVEASHFFDEFNGRPLEDPRLELLVNDGRNVLTATDRQFDVIVSEPSNPWITGVSNLFTREYFRAGAEHLADGGVFCQWLQIYEMRPSEVATLVATFATAFPTTYIFRGASGDLILLGSRTPFSLDAAALDRQIRARGPVADSLARINIRSASLLLSRLYLTPPATLAFAGDAPINTDDNALIEFLAPLRVGIADELTESDNLRALAERSQSVDAFITGASGDLLVDMAIGAISRNDTDRAESFVRESLGLRETARAHSVLGELREAAGHDEEALAEWSRALELAPDDLPTNLSLGKYYLGKGNVEFALAALDRAVRVAPDSARAHHLRGLALQALGKSDEALTEMELARRDAKYADSLDVFALHYGRALRDVGKYEDALPYVLKYSERVPKDPLGFYELGQLYLILGDRAFDESDYLKAEGAFLQSLTLDQTFPESHKGLSLAYRKQGRIDEADIEFDRYLRLKNAQ